METGKIKFELRGIGSELKERLLAVPIYQRSYAWTSDEVTEYWTDLRAAFAEGAQEYFLGTIVLTSSGSPPRDTVIDGQQRLATTCILIAAIRDEYKSRGDTQRATIVQQLLSTSDLESASEISRLSLNSEDIHFFDSRVVGQKALPGPTRPSHELMMAAYAYFRGQVTKVADDAGPEWPARLLQWITFLRHHLKVIVLEVPSDSDAFLIFETLNDRGADLTIADLLKNYLFGHAGTKLDAVRDSWMMVLGALEISSENMLFTTFLRHYWSSRHGAVRERELYKSIKEHVATQAQVLEFMTDLQGAAGLYAALLNSDHEHWESLGTVGKKSIETLIRLDLEQNRPLLLAALQHISDAELKNMLRAIVSWSVRGLFVGGIGGGTAEKNYCRAAVGIRKGDIKTTAELLGEIANIVPTDEAFKTAVSLALVPKASFARYCLIALEDGAIGKAEPELVANSNEEQVNLEHVLPKRASDKDWGKYFDAEERRAFVHRLGNLALLQKGPNGRIGNKPFADKKPVLSASALTLTSSIAAYSDWTKDSIRERQEKLAELAISVWPR